MSFFFVVKIADVRQQTTCGEHHSTTLPHGSSSKQHHVCAHGVCIRYAAATFLRRSLPLVTPPHHIFLLCSVACACPWHVRRSRHFRRKYRELCNSNLLTNPSLHLHLHKQYYYVHTRGNVLCRRFLPVPQITGTRQHGDKTTLRLQPCRTAAVGYIMYVRVACPRYAEVSCFCRRMSSVTPSYRMFLLRCRCVAVLIGHPALDGNTETFSITNFDTNKPLHSSRPRQVLHVYNFLRRFLAHVTDNTTQK